jgi:lysophospholipase L1-like esterase
MGHWATNFLLLLASCVCGIAIVEFGWYCFTSIEPQYRDEAELDRQYMLFGGGKEGVFQNIGDFFLYQPASVIHRATYFDTREGWVKEFEYEFDTNNIGLVQRESIDPAKPSVLILGDSFTEGQGAKPWFETLVPFFQEKHYQAINGGILGTGFSHWILLHDYLKGKNIAIKKLIVVFISNDYMRPIFYLRQQDIQCLYNYFDCIGDEWFYGMPPESQRHAFLEKLRKYRVNTINAPGFGNSLRKLLPATRKAYGMGRHLAIWVKWRLNARFHLFPEEDLVKDDSFYVKQVRYFSDLYGKDVIFVHLPDKDELDTGPDAEGIATRAAIRDAGAKLFDGFRGCGLTLSDYYVNDGHPNPAGYAKIATCVREAATEIFQ